MQLDTAMSLIRAAEAMSEKSKADVYKAAKSIMRDVMEAVDKLILISPAAEEDEDE
jgi:hypothetical protein